MSPHLSAEERTRYARHLAIPGFGTAAQQQLKAASVLVIGAGGLGSPLLLYLAAAGVGRLGIVDFDRVDATNLQRQVLYGVDDVGRFKADRAKEKIQALNPHVSVTVYRERFSVANARALVREYDLVADGTDNFPTRYLTNDACVLEGKPNVYASIFRFEGQVSVFNYLRSDGSRGPNYRDLYPSPPPPDLAPDCATGGVLGVLPGIIGSMQASEVIKVITGLGRPLDGRLFLFDAADFTARVLRIAPQKNIRIEGLIDYDEFCGIPKKQDNMPVKEITVKELHRMREEGETHQLIDVREPYEVEIATLNGELIPMAQIEGAAERIDRDKPVIVYCRSGKRSANAILMLEEKYGFDNLYNLKGGVLAWSDEIDPSMTKY